MMESPAGVEWWWGLGRLPTQQGRSSGGKDRKHVNWQWVRLIWEQGYLITNVFKVWLIKHNSWLSNMQ